MSEIKITDLVDQQAIDKIKELNDEIQSLLVSYTATAKELAKGVDINVRVVGDLDKLEKIFVEKAKEATVTTERLNVVIAQQGQVIANTTNTLSRQLMEQERVNKTQREVYTDTEKFKALMEQVNGSYENRIKRLIETNEAIATNKKHQDDLKKSLDMGRISHEKYNERLVQLTMTERELKQTKADLTNHLKNEEKEMQSVEGSYKNFSQRLELMKKAYKDLTAEERQEPLGKEMETAIQNLNAHLIDLAADMGEFHRNVGNYAIAGQKGVVSTESLITALNQQAITMQDVADQNKILMEARGMLDTSDERYAELLSMINEKLAENRKRLSDVSDIMSVTATSVSEAEAQNKRLAEALKQVDLSSEDAEKTIADLSAKIDENNKIIEKGTPNKASLKKDLKELVLEIANLSVAYQNMSDEEKSSAEGKALKVHIQDMIEEAGALKDAIADTNQAITNAASDTRGFDQLGGALQLAIDGFGLATGAAEMLGISSGDLAEIQTKLQAAIAASNAMQSIQNTLQGQSALMQGMALLQTRLRTTAENLHTAAQGKGVIATKALTVAQWAFNAAANANPIGLLVGLIVVCCAAVWGLVKAFNAFFGVSKEAIEQYGQQKKALDDLGDANDRLIDKMKARGAVESELVNQSLKNKQAEKEAAEALFARAKELYDDDEDEYKEALEAKEKADKEYEESKETGLNYLLKIQSGVYAHDREEAIGTLAYKIEVIEAEKAKQLELAEILYKNGEMTRQMYEDIVDAVNKSSQIKIEKAKEEGQKKTGSSVSDAKKRAEDLRKAVQDGEDALLDLIKDSNERQRQAETLSYNRKLKELKDALSKTKSTEVEMRKAINRQIEGLTASHEHKMHDLEFSGMERRNKTESDLISSRLSIVETGSKEEHQLRLRALENQQNAELIAIARSESDKTVTVEEASEMRANLAVKYADLAEKAEEEYAEKYAQLIEKKYADEQNSRDNDLISAGNALKVRYAQELAAAKGNAEKQAEIKKKYEEEQAKNAESYAIQTAEASIDMLDEILKNEQLSDEDRLKYEQDLAKAKIGLETAIADATIAQIERTDKADKDAVTKRLQYAQDWLQKTEEAVKGINDLVGSVYDGQLDRLDEQRDANTAAGEAEQERISNLVEQNVITQEEGEARKRAAEDKTAKKNEELEKKKAETKRRQAIFDKAISVANIGLNTAMAMMRLWANPGWPAAIPLQAVVGALSALQLATVLATPIPKYAKGTDHHKGGPAIVGDGGRPEVILFNGGAWLTPDKPTLVELPAGAAVYPSIVEYGHTISEVIAARPESTTTPKVVVNNNYQKLEEKMDRLNHQVKSIARDRRSRSRERISNRIKGYKTV